MADKKKSCAGCFWEFFFLWVLITALFWMITHSGRGVPPARPAEPPPDTGRAIQADRPVDARPR